MRFNRPALLGAALGSALAMPAFEVCLLTILLIDGILFDTTVAIRYLSRPLNLIALLAVLHVVGALIGAAVGNAYARMRSRPRLRVIAGGVRTRR